MKPFHLAVLGAVLAVAAILFFALGGDRARSTTRTRTTRDTPVRMPVDFDEYIPNEPPPADAIYELRVAITLPGGSPAAGARIDLKGRRPHSADADSGGVARFTGLEPGHYDLWARSGNAVGALGFELHADRDLRLRLRAAVAVRGRVFDINKNPLAGATVEAVAIAAGDGSWVRYTQRLSSPDTMAAQARSGPDGKYELLLPGKDNYGLRAWAPGYAAEVESTRRYETDQGGIDFYLQPGRTILGRVFTEDGDPAGGARVVAAVSTGRPADIAPKVHSVTPADGSFHLTVPNADRIYFSVTAAGYAKHVNPRLQLTGREIIVRLKHGIAIRLRTVEKAVQRPVEGVTVTIMHQGGRREGRSDAKGDVVIENVPVFRRDSGTGLTARLVSEEHVPQRLSLRSQKIIDGVIDVGAVELEKGGVVRGTVRDKTSGLPVRDALVRPFGGRSVRLSFMRSVEVRTDEGGKYELRGVPLDAGTVIAQHVDYVMDLSGDDIRRHMRGGGLFGQGAAEAVVDIQLVPARAVRGLVVDPEGEPVAGARVETAVPLRGSLNRLLGGEEPSAVSDSSGRFVLTGLAPDESAKLLATHRDYGTSTHVDAVAGGSEVTLHLEPPLLIRGTVVDDEGLPIKNVRVSVTPARQPVAKRGTPLPSRRGSTRPGYTDDKGAFAIRNTPAGELTISFDHRGYAVVKREIAIAAGKEVHDVGTIRLSRGPGIELLVVRTDGKPFPNIPVNASWAGPSFGSRRSAGRTWGNGVSDERGRVAIHGLAEGPFRVSVTGRQHFSDRPVVQTGSNDVRLIVREAATLIGRVIAGGEGVGGARLRADLTTDAGSRAVTNWAKLITSARTNKDGTFTMRGLPPDLTFILTISHRSHRTKTVKGVSASQSGRVFTLETGVRIGGVVMDVAGPVASASLRVYEDGRMAKWGRTDSDGRFDFSGLGAGDLEIEVRNSISGHIPSGRIAMEAGDLNVRIVVKRGMTISGKVVFKSTTYERGLMIEVLDGEGKSAGTAWVTKKRPEFFVRGLREASYAVRAVRWMGGAREVVSEVTGVSGGSGLEIEVD